MRRIGVVAACAAAVLLPPGRGGLDRTLPLCGPEAETASLLAVSSDATGSRLERLDPATLAPVARSVLPASVDGWVVSPDRRLLALGLGSYSPVAGSTLRFANVPTLRLARRGVKLDGPLRAALWPAEGRLLALVDARAGLELETVDTVAKRVTARRDLPGTVGSTGRFHGGLVLLLERPNEIGEASLAVVGPDGSVRTVGLDRIRAGSHWPQDVSNDPIGATRSPALAVDPAGTAYVVDAGGLAAAVDLRSLAVSYHTLANRSLLGRLAGWLTPPAQAKGMNGPQRSAVWLGDGLLALTGADYATTRAKDGSVSFTQTPAGLAVVDTHDWTVRTLAADASGVTVADGALLATGGAWSSSGESGGNGLAAYGPDGTLRWRLFPGGRPWVVGAVGGLALVQDAGAVHYSIVDVASGRIVRSGPAREEPRLLVGTGS